MFNLTDLTQPNISDLISAKQVLKKKKKKCNKVESADKCVQSVFQGADLCHIMAAVLAGWGCTVAAVYTIALFDQNP